MLPRRHTGNVVVQSAMKVCASLLLCTLAGLVIAQPVPSERYDCLKWRCIGPFRGGRTVGLEGVWSQPNVLYMGVNNGGVWRTTDYGRTWNPIFDDQPTGSIGCLAIAQSNPNVLYVGSGEGLQRPDLSVGDGVYKTTDAGKTWVNTGLKDGLQISGMAVDPKNPNRVFAAVLGHPYGPNRERGLYRTLDGGKTWTLVLGKDANTGAVAVAIDPKQPQTVYASLWSARQAPWENGDWQGKTSGLFKSTDGGSHWRALTQGLPTPAQGRGRIGFSICGANPRRVYATVNADVNGGLYRSDDAGDHWIKTNDEARVVGRGDDFAEVRTDPKNPNVVYEANTSMYRSTDAGVTFTCFKGAPGGDDYHTIWIHPNNPDEIAIASDQGATISVNHGETWSSWYNQPTAQFYHVSTDNQFPYWVYGGQQESGSAGVASRGRDGQITFRDWNPVGAEEYAYVAPDPLNPDLIYSSKGSRFHRSTGQVDDVHPHLPGLRFIRTMPMLFSPADPHVLFLAANKLLRTIDGGNHWTAISPDLSRPTWNVPAAFATVSDEGKSMKQRGVIYAVAPSPKDVNLIWAGTDDGLVWLTQDGGQHWKDVTPPGVTSWSKVSQIDAGHFDLGTAYVSVNRLRCDDIKPYIYVSHDFGHSWKLSVSGIPENAPVNTVREDPKNPGLLFCGTERQVLFSADGGENWSPLRLNMPATSIRDLVVKDDDLVVGTHGRSLWILDSMTALRQLGAVLYAPTTAYLVEWNRNMDTPLPPEEPAGKNPPDGVPLDFFLAENARRVSLEIVDAKGIVVRSFRSDQPEKAIDPKTITVDPRWARNPEPLSIQKGSHRFVWDLRFASKDQGLGMAAIWHNTPISRGPFVPAGDYRVRLTVDGKVFEQPLVIRLRF